ncbi:MAG: carboxypeptidase-like regulatory domain-containing protein, partial [Candidatus Sulfotelmatobacter sp.]
MAASIFLVQVSLAQTLKPPGSTSAQNILVTVNDENDVAVPSALVFLQAAPQAVALRCVTDFAGHCQFSNLSAGTYQLRVEKQ